MYYFNLSDCLLTLELVNNYIKNRFNTDLYILGTSLTGRVVIKLMGLTQRELYKHVGLLLPVVDVSKTIKNITQTDLFGMEIAGKGAKEWDVLGNIISWDCVTNAIKYKYHNLDATLEDLKNNKIQTTIFTAKQDEWVEHEDLLKVFTEDQKYKIVTFDNLSHKLERNLAGLKLLLKEIVSTYVQLQYGNNFSIYIPDFNEIVFNSRIDRINYKAG